MKIDAAQSEELQSVNRVIHDEWFDVAAVRFDPVSCVLKVPFERRAATKMTAEPVMWVLEIRDIRDWVLEETEGTGRYDFNELEYMETNGRLTIKTGIPLTFRLHVNSLRVAAYEQGSA